jgi:hypothetical protein
VKPSDVSSARCGDVLDRVSSMSTASRRPPDGGTAGYASIIQIGEVVHLGLATVSR